MRPACVIFADDVDVTKIINPRLVELSIVDEAGMRADRLELTLDDRDSTLELPRKGVRLRVLLGYAETGVADMGSWLVDEVTLSGPNPRLLRVRAQALDVQGAIKSHRSKTWQNTTLGVVVQTIAAAHGLEPVISPSLAKGVITYVVQTNESDMHFLSRIAVQFGATVKPADGKLVVAQQGKGKTATDKDMPGVTVTLEDITSYNCVLPERGSYARVVARWHNVKTGQTETVEARGANDAADGPDFTINHDYPDRETAQTAAQAKKDAMDRATATLSISMPGNPLAAAEVPLIVKGIRDGIDTTEETAWRIVRVRHSFARDFTTAIDAEMGSAAVEEKKEEKKAKKKK